MLGDWREEVIFRAADNRLAADLFDDDSGDQSPVHADARSAVPARRSPGRTWATTSRRTLVLHRRHDEAPAASSHRRCRLGRDRTPAWSKLGDLSAEAQARRWKPSEDWGSFATPGHSYAHDGPTSSRRSEKPRIFASAAGTGVAADSRHGGPPHGSQLCSSSTHPRSRLADPRRIPRDAGSPPDGGSGRQTLECRLGRVRSNTRRLDAGWIPVSIERPVSPTRFGCLIALTYRAPSAGQRLALGGQAEP